VKDEGANMKIYICPRCQPSDSRSKPSLPFGDTVSFAAEAASHKSKQVRQKSKTEEKQEDVDNEQIGVDEENQIEWKQRGEVIYCGDENSDNQEELSAYDPDDPTGFIFVAYVSFQDILEEREEASKTRQEWTKKKQQQKYLQKRLIETEQMDAVGTGHQTNV